MRVSMAAWERDEGAFQPYATTAHRIGDKVTARALRPGAALRRLTVSVITVTVAIALTLPGFHRAPPLVRNPLI